MKKFLLRILWFFLPVVVLAYPLDWFISQNLRKSNAFAVKELPVWNALFSGQLRTDIAIYGSSRAWLQIDSPMMERELGKPTYNFGINAHNFWLQYLRHRMLCDQNQNPKLIIQTLDIHTLMKNKDLVNSEQFLPYMLWNSKIRKWTEGYNGFSIFDYQIPLVRYYAKIQALREARSMWLHPERNKPQRIQGYMGRDISWNGDFERAVGKLKHYEVRPEAPSIALFEGFLKECRDSNIKVVLVYTPEYIEGQKLMHNRAGIIQMYREISAKYGIPFYDYSSHSLSMQKKYFYNTTHLNKTGAELLTKDLIGKLRRQPGLAPLFENRP